MSKSLTVYPEKCNSCRACELACSFAKTGVFNPALSCIQVNLFAEAAFFVPITCTQCGECIDVCPTQALGRAKNGVVRRDLALCVGCLACVGFCRVGAPHGAAMRAHPAHVEPFKCVACGACARACPEEALKVTIDAIRAEG